MVNPQLSMHRLFLILVVLAGCNSGSTKKIPPEIKLGFLDSIKKQCQSASILFQTNYPNGEVLLEAKRFIGKKQIDSLFSYIGDSFFDSATRHSNSKRVGKISFCRDTLGKIDLLDLDFFFHDGYEGYYENPEKNALRFRFTPLGKKEIMVLYKKVKVKLKI